MQRILAKTKQHRQKSFVNWASEKLNYYYKAMGNQHEKHAYRINELLICYLGAPSSCQLVKKNHSTHSSVLENLITQHGLTFNSVMDKGI